MTKLVLFTRRYPYFKTESFLETEIKYLSENFDKIIIIPSEVGGEARDLPENVIVDSALSNSYNNKIRRVLLTVFSLFFYKCLFERTSNIISIKRIFLFSSRYLGYATFLKSNKEKFDRVILYSYWLNEAAYALVLNRKNFPSSKIVSRAHRFDIYEKPDPEGVLWPFRKKLMLKIDRIYSISIDGKKYFEKKYGFGGKVEIAKLGVVDKGKVAQDSKKDQISIVSVSRITNIKRVELIYRALEKLASNNPSIKISWSHFGTGPLFSNLEQKVEKNELTNLNVTLHGHVYNQQIYKYYENTAIDCFMNVSSSEGIPVSIMEAQSYGIPVIATNVGGTNEIVNENVGVLLCSNPKIEEITDAVIKIKEKGISKNLIKNEWSKKYNAEVNYSLFAGELLKLLVVNK